MQEPPHIAAFRQMLASRSVSCNQPITCYNGKIRAIDNSLHDYETSVGLNPYKANECDAQWMAFNENLIDHIVNAGYSEDELRQIDATVQFGSDHWNWLYKSKETQTDEFHWLYLYAQGKPQAACLLRFPKKSILCAENIFYIEFLAVAPWNRKNPMEQQFCGVGSTLLRDAMRYVSQYLGIHPAFSLHALKQAIGFYEKIGMTASPAHDKQEHNLVYYEMPADMATKFMEAS